MISSKVVMDRLDFWKSLPSQPPFAALFPPCLSTFQASPAVSQVFFFPILPSFSASLLPRLNSMMLVIFAVMHACFFEVFF